MKNTPNVGFICVGDTALELSGAICCAGKLMKIFKGAGFDVGGCYSCMCPSLQRMSLKSKMEDMCKINSLVVTIGGEGWRKTHVIPDITEEISDRCAAYFSNILSCADVKSDCDGTGAVKDKGRDFTYASRANAGFCGDCLVINLPCEIEIARRRLISVLPSLNLVINSAAAEKGHKKACFFANYTF